MEGATAEVAENPKEQLKDNKTNVSNEEPLVTNSKEDFRVIKDDKTSDSETHSDDLSSNDEQSNVLSSVNSQFYESSDNKVDYAIKLEDNDTLSDIEDIKTDSASADSEDSALGSLPPDSVLIDREEDAQDRSEGSDSGLGAETTEELKLPCFNLSLPCTSSLRDSNKPHIPESIDETTDCVYDKKKIDSDTLMKVLKTPLRSSLKRKHNDKNNEEPSSKRKKLGIKFDNVTVFYFPRAQGFSCVPSQGGSTLGMEWEHSHIQTFTLAEHALEQRRLHRQILQQLKNERNSLQGASLSSSEDSDTEEETSDISESELDLDSYYFLQPVPTRQRRALLRAAGVRKIEGYEKDECRDIRTSREFCGCACKGTCNPESCLCSLAGIKCQVDRLNFPCGCTRDGCGNTTGRIEFNPVRVRTHFIHTLMRLGIEKKKEETQEAAKRQWASEVHNPCASPLVTNNSYERERCLSHEDGLLRDVNLSPRIEVESCVNSGSFNNVHCDINNIQNHSNIQENSTSFGYGNSNQNIRNINESAVHFENTNNYNNHVDPYTSNILQGKGPPFTTTNVVGFDAISNSIHRFPCDLNYAYEHHTDSQQFKGLQSFSASTFEEFAHNSQISMFSHYGHMYVPEYMQKSNIDTQEPSKTHFRNTSQNNYEMYKNVSECISTENKSDPHYTTLTTLPYQSNNKLQSVESDENWFSHKTLLNLDHSDQTTQDAADLESPATQTNTESNITETTENFGELIKKTMVESVTV